jgi:electron transport complex protein RnfG
MKDILRLTLSLIVIAAISAGVLAYVNEKTAEPIARSLREEKMRAIRNVLPPYDNTPDQDTVTVRSGEELVTFYRGRRDGKIVGAAFGVVSEEGYGGDIELLVGVDTVGVIRGVEVLRHRETPGLGAKVTGGNFRNQYQDKSLHDPEEWKVTKDGGVFKQVTGATISSRAVTEAIARGLKFFWDNKEKVMM